MRKQLNGLSYFQFLCSVSQQYQKNLSQNQNPIENEKKRKKKSGKKKYFV